MKWIFFFFVYPLNIAYSLYLRNKDSQLPLDSGNNNQIKPITSIEIGNDIKAMHALNDKKISQILVDGTKKIDYNALSKMNLNKQGVLLLADDPSEVSKTTSYNAQLTDSFLFLNNISTNDREMEISISAIKMPLLDVQSTNTCFKFYYQPKDDNLETYLFCASSVMEKNQWMTGIMGNKFVMNATENINADETQSTTNTATIELPDVSTKEERWKLYLENQKKLQDSLNGDNNTSEMPTDNKIINVEIKDVDKGPQLIVNGVDVDWSE